MKDKFIDSWIPVAGPFSGAVSPIKAMLNGYNLGISILPDSDAVVFNRYLGKKKIKK